MPCQQSVCWRETVSREKKRDERGHLFRGAGRRAMGWDSVMGDVVSSCWVVCVCVCVCIYSSHKYAQVIIQMCSDSCGVWWVNKWMRFVPELQLRTPRHTMTNFLSALLGPVITPGQNNVLPC